MRNNTESNPWKTYYTDKIRSKKSHLAVENHMNESKATRGLVSLVMKERTKQANDKLRGILEYKISKKLSKIVNKSLKK